jgi:hypothetical protein
MSWPPRARTWKAPGSRPGGSASSPIGHPSPRQVLPLASRSYKERPDVGPGGVVRSAGFEPAASGISSQPLCHVGVRAPGAATRCRPGVTRCTRAGPQPCAAARLPAVDSNHDHPRSERGVLPVRRTGIGTGGAIRTRAGQGLSLPSPAIGLRPRAPPGSRTPCPPGKSRVLHLYSSRRSKRIAGIEPASSAWRAAALPLSYIRVVPAGTEPASAGFRPAANPSQLENHGREAGTRTPSAWSQTRRADPYATSREWRCPESNRVGNACRARPLPQLLIPRCREDGASRLMLTLWSCQLACTFAPQGGASHGRKDSNPDQAGWSRSCCRYTTPINVFSYANRPSGDFPAGGFLVICFCFYPEASTLVPRIAHGRMAACQS